MAIRPRWWPLELPPRRRSPALLGGVCRRGEGEPREGGGERRQRREYGALGKATRRRVVRTGVRRGRSDRRRRARAFLAVPRPEKRGRQSRRGRSGRADRGGSGRGEEQPRP